MLCCSCDQLVSFKGYFELNHCLSQSLLNNNKNENTNEIDDNSMIEEEEHYSYLVMEYCDGGNLEEYLTKQTLQTNYFYCYRCCNRCCLRFNNLRSSRHCK